MLLAIDIGNTNVVIGVYDSDHLVTSWRLATNRDKMPDEWWADLSVLARADNLDLHVISGAILASGVPVLTTAFSSMIERRLGIRPHSVTATSDLGIRVLTDNPAEVGPDRLVNAVAAHRRFGGPAIVVDFGTATTFDVVSAEGDYLGGAIAPGIGVALEALTRRAARLAAVELTVPPSAIGRNTVHSMQAGAVLGYIALIEGLVERITRELGDRPTVIATGGLGEIITPHTPAIQSYEPDLTLEGLRIVYDRLRATTPPDSSRPRSAPALGH